MTTAYSFALQRIDISKDDDEKIKKALVESSGDMQIAIRYLYLQKHQVNNQ